MRLALYVLLAGAATLLGAIVYVVVFVFVHLKPDDHVRPGTLYSRLESQCSAPGEIDLGIAPADWSRLTQPPVQSRPWARWWWPGADVETEVIHRQLRDMKQAGFGGVEIQPFSMGTSPVTDQDENVRSRVYSVDTPRYFHALNETLNFAAQLGMRVDLTHYSGWPAGSPVISPSENLKSLAWASTRFSGGGVREIQIPRPRAGYNAWLMTLAEAVHGMGEFADFDMSAATLVSVVAARPQSGRRFFPWSEPTELDPESVHVLDDQVEGELLRWEAPPGDWELIAVWMLPSGEQASLSAFPTPAYVMDVLDSRTVCAHYEYAFGSRTGLEKHFGRSLRAIFNDSLEFKVDRMVSDDFLEEFRKRRGYDLRPYLPSVFAPARDNFFLQERGPVLPPAFKFGDPHDRVRYDYQLTLSDLTIERFIDTTRNWAGAHGLLSRAQSYGMDIDLIRAQGQAHIPETEQYYAGGADFFLRIAFSAALLYDRPLVSAEAFVWERRDYAYNATMLKVAADRLFAAGVNHVVYHGIPYDWRSKDREKYFADVGWDPWSSPERNSFTFSGNYSPRTNIWRDIPRLNEYIARAQHLLRQGKPEADVLIYYPFLGMRSYGYGPEDVQEPIAFGEFALADPARGSFGREKQGTDDPRTVWLRKIQPVLDEVVRRGLTYAWVNGDALQNRLSSHGRIRGGGRYGALLFFEPPSVAAADLAAARTLQKQGTPVLLVGQTPRRQPGFLDWKRGDALVHQLAAEIRAHGKTPQSPAELAEVLIESAQPSLHYAAKHPVRRASRVLDDGVRVHFFSNESDHVQTIALQRRSAGAAWWFDAMSGDSAGVLTDRSGATILRLKPYESRFLIAGVRRPVNLHRQTEPGRPGQPHDREWIIKNWRMQMGDLHRSQGLFDWRTDEEILLHSEEAVYRAEFELTEEISGRRFALSAGLVPGSAVVRVNGGDAGSVSLPPSETEITQHLKRGSNQIEIIYRPAERNQLLAQYRAGDGRLQQFRGRSEHWIPAGLQGPIRVLAYENE